MRETCNSSSGQSVWEKVRSLYTELAQCPMKDFGWGKGKDNARALGYDPAWLVSLPAAVWESSAAVGNPFSLGPVHNGETVVDLGCGAGADVCLAALLVGPQGRVIGVDVTPAMVEKARANAALAGLRNVEIVEADIAGLPIPDACTDVIISNGTINLSPHKTCVLKEASRVLKPGGRFYIADMVRDVKATRAQSGAESPEGSWADCVAGTLAPECFLQLLEEAGFADAVMVGRPAIAHRPRPSVLCFEHEKRAPLESLCAGQFTTILRAKAKTTSWMARTSSPQIPARKPRRPSSIRHQQEARL